MDQGQIYSASWSMFIQETGANKKDLDDGAGKVMLFGQLCGPWLAQKDQPSRRPGSLVCPDGC